MFDSELKPPPTDTALCEELPAGEWETVQLHGCWKNGLNAGGSRNFPSFHTNPCFPLSIPAGPGKSSVKVTLRQHCLDSKCCPIGFHIFQVRLLVSLIPHLPRVKHRAPCSLQGTCCFWEKHRIDSGNNTHERYGVT